MTLSTTPGPAEVGSDTLADAIASVHTSGGLGTLTDELATPAEVRAALEPVLAAVFSRAAAGEEPDQDEIAGDLGLLGSAAPDEFNPNGRVRPYLSAAVEDGQAYREITCNVLLRWTRAETAAAARAEWCFWEALVPDDITAPATATDVYVTARNIARQWKMREPYIVAAEPALATVVGFRMSGLPLNRSVWSEALDGARAGLEEHEEYVAAEERRTAYFAERVAAAIGGESE